MSSSEATFYSLTIFQMKITKANTIVELTLKRFDNVDVTIEDTTFEAELNEIKKAITFEGRDLFGRTNLNGFSITSEEIKKMKMEMLENGKTKFENGSKVIVTYATDIAVWEYTLRWEDDVIAYLQTVKMNAPKIGYLTIKNIEMKKEKTTYTATKEELKKYSDIMENNGQYGD